MFLYSGFRLGVQRAMAHALTILHFERSAPPISAASMVICLYLGDILLEHLLLFFPVEHHQFRFLLLFNTIFFRCSINNHKVSFRSLTNIINRTFTTVIQLPQLSAPPNATLLTCSRSPTTSRLSSSPSSRASVLTARITLPLESSLWHQSRQ
jgi:hypothetical protein